MKNKIIKLSITAFLILSLVYLFFAIYLYAFSIPYISQAFHLAVTVQPEPFTELYFEDHLTLPTKVTRNKVYIFKFTIHNLENKNFMYPYEVYADLGGEKLLIERKTVSLKSHEYKTIEEKFIIPDSFTRLKIVVNLINKNQQINFWMEGKNLN